MSAAIIWHNGKFKNEQDKILTIHDRMRLGEGVFNTVLSIDGKMQHAKRHFKKLLKNSKLFLGDWQAPEAEKLIEIAHEVLAKNNATQGQHSVNCIISAGPSGGGIRLPENPKPEIMIRCLPFSWDYTKKLSAIISQTVRRNEGSPLSNIKCSNYGDNILALREAQQQGADDVILLNNAGHVTCSSIATLIAIIDGQFVTPPLSDGPQEGTTRSIFLEKFDVAERSLTPDELYKSEGIYLLNSLRGAIPLHKLDDIILPEPTIPLDKDFHLS